MPYNNTPIAPSKEVTGHVSLPLARVQKIINADPERLNVTKNAAFAIALATEMFIQHLATTTHNVVKTERKPRRNIQYRDVSSAIAKTDNLEFAVDVVPKTMLWKDAKKKREEREEREKLAEQARKSEKKRRIDADADEDAQTKSDAQNHLPHTNGNANDTPPTPLSKPDPAPDAMDVDERVQDSDPDEDAAATQLEMEMRGPQRQKTASPEAPSAATTKRSGGGFTSINGVK